MRRHGGLCRADRLVALGCVAALAWPLSTTSSSAASPTSVGRLRAYHLPALPVTVPPNPTVEENAKQGTTNWRLGRQGGEHAIEGFADHTDVGSGGTFGLYVSTTAGRWRVAAFRVGWYGGLRGRLVWRSTWHRGRRQRAAVVSPVTRTVRAPWRRSLTVTASDWPAGSYLLKLTSSAGNHRYVPITVRSSSVTGSVVIVNEQFTWQAYNAWGGRSLYLGPGGYGDRSLKVSFDRPYDRGGAYKFQEFEQVLISRAERLGLPIAYTTDVYLSAHSAGLVGGRAVASPGHQEYWSWNEREAFLAARAKGANLAFFGANAQYWQVRMHSSALGDRRAKICYKTAWQRGPSPRRGPARGANRWGGLPTRQPGRRIGRPGCERVSR